MMKAVLKLIRVHQWVKNLFVFLPMFFAGRFLDLEVFENSFLGFLMFSFTASAVYVINDYVDIEKDRLHPSKKDRPLASGAISKSTGLIIFAICLLIAICIGVISGNWKADIIVLAYFIMNLAYSFGLKHIPILDVIIIAVGFLMRVLVGGYITGITVTKWAILLVFMLAMLMALGKRFGELVGYESSGKTRKALDGYNNSFLRAAIGMISSIAIMCYIMYTLSPEAEVTFGNGIDYLYFTAILVIAGILRYLQQTIVYNKTESPTKMIYKDLFLQVVLVLWFTCFVVLIYIK